MRIGLVCPYSLDAYGGVQNHVRDLAAVLLNRGHDVRVLAPGERGESLPDHVEVVGKAIPVTYNGSVARVAFGPRVAARVRRWLRDGAFDVLHVHEPVTPSVSLLALWASECPVVATFHTSNVRSRAMTSVAAMLRPALEKISARIAVSETARSTLVHHLGGEPVVIPNGIFCAPFVEARPVSRWQQPGPAVVFLGRLDEPRKGLHVLLDALPSVLRAHPSARLLVAGRGDSETSYARVPAAAAGRVEFLGAVSDEERAGLLSSAAVYVAPQTHGESFGIVLVEAMAAGAPVVASDLPAFRAVLGEGRFGDLFIAGDPAAAGEAISRLLSEPVRREALRAAASIDVRRYDWSRVSTEIEAVYETVAQPVARRVGP